MPQTQKNILLIGAGKMGGAMLASWMKDPSLSVTILDPGTTAATQDALTKGANHIRDAAQIPTENSVVILAIKPQMFESVAPSLCKKISNKVLIISVLAGTSLSRLEAYFPENPIIRAMPNTPSAIGKGISAITGNQFAQADHLNIANTLLSPCGPVRPVGNESLIDAVTAISGSGPAYIFYFVEALTEAAQELGLTEADAKAFSRQMVIGAGALLDASEENASQLRLNVTSPNGTTQAALNVLMDEDGLAPLLKKVTKAAYDRAQALANE